MERWLPVASYEGIYEVSDAGRVRNAKGAVLSGYLGGPRPGANYRYVRLFKTGLQRRRKVHQLVLEAFVGPRKPKEIGLHRNGDALDNRVTNLYWGTHHDNSQDALRHGTRVHGERVPQAKLSVEDVASIRASSDRSDVLAERFRVTRTQINRVRRGAQWRGILIVEAAA